MEPPEGRPWQLLDKAVVILAAGIMMGLTGGAPGRTATDFCYGAGVVPFLISGVLYPVEFACTWSN